MSRHPHTTTLTLLIMAQQFQNKDLEYNCYEVLSKAADLAGWPDVQKADLYAMLAERLDERMTMGQMELVIDRALWDNTNRFA